MTARWYTRNELSPVGPFEEGDVARRMQSGEISPEDLLWRDGADQWRAAIEWPEFKRLQVPAYQFLGKISADEPVWIVLTRGPQGFRTLGPWSQKTILEKISQGELRVRDHVWTRGMTGWARVASRPDFMNPQGKPVSNWI